MIVLAAHAAALGFGARTGWAAAGATGRALRKALPGRRRKGSRRR